MTGSICWRAAPALTMLVALPFAGVSTAQSTQAAIAAAADAGGGPQVRLFNQAASPLRDFFAYTPTFSGGVRIALGDIDGDGISDMIVAPGTGGTNVRVFNGADTALLRDFFAFGPTFQGGVYVAVGDVNGDGRVDIIAGAGTGGTALRVFSGRTLQVLHDFAPFGDTFTGGVRVASGDIDGDGYAEIVVGAGPGATPEVRVFDGRSGLSVTSFLAYAPTFTGGIFVAAGDTDGDGRADIVTGADSGGLPHVKVFRGHDQVEQASFLAYGPAFTGGVRVATSDIDGDGDQDVVTGAGPGGSPQVNLYTGGAPTTFNAFTSSFRGGVFVAGPVGTIKVLRDGFE